MRAAVGGIWARPSYLTKLARAQHVGLVEEALATPEKTPARRREAMWPQEGLAFGRQVECGGVWGRARLLDNCSARQWARKDWRSMAAAPPWPLEPSLKKL